MMEEELTYRIDVSAKVNGHLYQHLFRIDNINNNFVAIRDTIKEKFTAPEFRVECYEFKSQGKLV